LIVKRLSTPLEKSCPKAAEATRLVKAFSNGGNYPHRAPADSSSKTDAANSSLLFYLQLTSHARVF